MNEEIKKQVDEQMAAWEIRQKAMEESQARLAEYSAKHTSIATKPGCWDYLNVDIFKKEEKIGEYQRNYSSMYRTFHPFEQNGKQYALYSKDYTATRVMELPSCKDICGEEEDSCGFCPVDFYVPKEAQGQFGFVAGCVWGDDSSWKIEFLDLSKISEGIFKREDRFGYIELPYNQSLKEAISAEDYDPIMNCNSITINFMHRFNFKKNIEDELADQLLNWLPLGNASLKVMKHLSENLCPTCGLYKKPRWKSGDDPWACKGH